MHAYTGVMLAVCVLVIAGLSLHRAHTEVIVPQPGPSLSKEECANQGIMSLVLTLDLACSI